MITSVEEVGAAGVYLSGNKITQKVQELLIMGQRRKEYILVIFLTTYCISSKDNPRSNAKETLIIKQPVILLRSELRKRSSS